MEIRPILRKIAVAVFLIVFSYLLQTAIFSKIELAGVTPNLMIIVTSFYGFMKGRKEGAVIGFFCGMIMDLYSGSYFGAFALIYLWIGYANGLFLRLFYGDDVKLPLLFVILSDLVYCGIVYMVFVFSQGNQNLPLYFINICLPEMIYTVGVAFIAYFLVIRLFEWSEKKDEKRNEASFVR